MILNKEKQSLSDSNWTPTKKYICLLGITDAMRYLHLQGIIHRDLKPENILVDENYYPHICDFGLSKCFSNSLTNSMKMSMTGKVGTPLYMAPEILNDDDDHYGPAVDVYAFAIISYETVTQIEPFSQNGKSPSLKNLLNQTMTGRMPKFTEGVTQKMKDLINQCWCQEPQDRPSFSEIFEMLSSDFSYLDETVDEDEIREYLDVLEENRKNEAVFKSKNDRKNNEAEIEQIEEEKKAIQTELSDLKTKYDDSQRKIKFFERINPYVIVLENDYLSRKIRSEIISQMPKAQKLDNREYEYNNMWYIMVNMLRVFTIAAEINFFKEPFNIYTSALRTDDTNVLKSDTNFLLTLIGDNMHSKLAVLDAKKRCYQCRYPYISYLQYESPSKNKRDGFYSIWEVRTRKDRKQCLLSFVLELHQCKVKQLNRVPLYHLRFY